MSTGLHSPHLDGTGLYSKRVDGGHTFSDRCRREVYRSRGIIVRFPMAGSASYPRVAHARVVSWNSSSSATGRRTPGASWRRFAGQLITWTAPPSTRFPLSFPHSRVPSMLIAPHAWYGWPRENLLRGEGYALQRGPHRQGRVRAEFTAAPFGNFSGHEWDRGLIYSACRYAIYTPDRHRSITLTLYGRMVMGSRLTIGLYACGSDRRKPTRFTRMLPDTDRGPGLERPSCHALMQRQA